MTVGGSLFLQFQPIILEYNSWEHVIVFRYFVVVQIQMIIKRFNSFHKQNQSSRNPGTSSLKPTFFSACLNLQGLKFRFPKTGPSQSLSFGVEFQVGIKSSLWRSGHYSSLIVKLILINSFQTPNVTVSTFSLLIPC